jgi:hypothetical protein
VSSFSLFLFSSSQTAFVTSPISFTKALFVRDRGRSLGVGQIPRFFHNTQMRTFGAKHAAPHISHCAFVRGHRSDGGPGGVMELETERSIFHDELRKHPPLSHGEPFALATWLATFTYCNHLSLTVFWPFGLSGTICWLSANRTYSYYPFHNLTNVDVRSRVRARLVLFCMFKTLRGRLSLSFTR